jgi:hypothetical protein
MIKDKSIRDRFCKLGLDDSLKEKEYNEQLDNLNLLLIKIKLRLKSINDSLEEAREYRKELNVSNNFSIIESLDNRINKLSNKRILLLDKINEIEEYVKKEKKI